MNDPRSVVFNPPPGWPEPPKGWVPPKGWKPDPSWPTPPSDWQFWLANKAESGSPLPSGVVEAGIAGSQAQVATDIEQRTALLEAENIALRKQLASIAASAGGIVDLNDEHVLQDAGIYRYHHPLENAVAYQTQLAALTDRITAIIKANGAIESSNSFTLDGSLAKGRAMTGDLSRLMLRAYNAEAENVIRAMRVGNSTTAIERLDASRDAISKLGRLMDLRITDAYHALRILEIELTSDYLMKKEEEREAVRAERERLREERRVEKELAIAREKLEKERSHLVAVISRMQTAGTSDPELERKLADVDSAIAQNDYRAANIRAGYVYVISNRGAFGGHVVKIGLTRRLDPFERINELGDASVPFRFDVHAVYFSEDAVTLENELHQRFASTRLNWANFRKEFFFATPTEVRAVLAEKLGNLLEFNEHAESSEYLQSVGHWPSTASPNGLAKEVP